MMAPSISRRVAMAGGLAFGASAVASVVQAQSKADVRRLLIDLPGWEAPPASATNAVAELMFQREYTRDTSTVLVTFEISLLSEPTAYAALADHAPDQKPWKGVIDGFTVQRVHVADDDSGAIAVTLTDGRRRPSAFLLEYESLSPDEALDIARQFDWLAMRQAVSNAR